MKLITLNIDTIKALCDKHHVKSLFVFGSVTSNELKPSSDIDLVVDIDSNDPLSYSDDYFGLKSDAILHLLKGIMLQVNERSHHLILCPLAK